MLITGGRIAEGADSSVERELWVRQGRISFSPPSTSEPALDLRGYLVLPGLINAHDHLELNLFPRLGRGPYNNATDWARDIYRPRESPVREHAAVPKPLRLQWGGLKNLLSGVTTVAHHNDPHPALFDRAYPIHVLKRYGWAHSLHFAPDWQARFRQTPVNAPFMIHAAEGADEEARHEIRKLETSRVLSRKTVLIHGVGMGADELRLVLRRKASVVWCPSSNYFTLGRSLGEEVLRSDLPIALATDSAMTAQGDLLDELRFANKAVEARRLYMMVTSAAAQILGLPAGSGKLLDGGPADLLVMRDRGQTPAETLLGGLPDLVMVRGKIALVSKDFGLERIRPDLRPLKPISVESRGQYFVSFPIDRLAAATKAFLKQEIRLAGKAVAV